MHPSQWHVGGCGEVYSQPNVDTEQERESQFVLGKQRPTDIVIKIVLEVILKVTQTTVEHLRPVAAVNDDEIFQIYFFITLFMSLAKQANR